MDDKLAFMELSALLTGLNKQILDDPEDRKLFEPIAEEYRHRLSGAFSSELDKLFNNLLSAYKTLADVTPKPPINDTLLAALQAKQEFKDAEFTAKQIVNIWYFSQFHASEDDEKNGHFLDGGFYERGLVWQQIKTHPIGFSNQPSGYWTAQP
jgi:hypothetical protein